MPLNQNNKSQKIMHLYRSHKCNELNEKNKGEEVRLSGWVHRVRDHGGVLFIDLRDHYGITQIVIDPDSKDFGIAEKVRSEWVIKVDGKVRLRDEDTINPELPTGKIEIFADNINVLSEADELPLPVFGEPEYPEDIRLTYRFLDLRRETLHNNIMRRMEIISDIRQKMKDNGFFEFATPILTASSPEGARDFLVPSRIHPGQFYALPQAPQQYKQLVMMSGFDRYFQIAPCFRDEDPRADRLPGEFYQLDVEMSFVEQDDILNVMEKVVSETFEVFADGKKVQKEWKKIPYYEAMRKYGTDKPDLRIPIEMQEVTKQFEGSGFKLFAEMIAKDEKNQVWGIPVKGGGSRAFCDRMNSWAQQQGQPGLGYIFWREAEGGGGVEGSGPIAKNIGEDRTKAISTQMNLEAGDACFFVAGVPKHFVDFAGEARIQIANEMEMIDDSVFSFCWIVDFPFYEWDEENKKIEFSHNPFSMPQGGIDALNNNEPLGIMAHQYDMVCNGYEIASGGIRNHLPEVMVKAFEIAGLSKDVVEERFGALYKAFKLGAPPHGGIAAGIDRIVMLLCGTKNLREITMFPMNQQAKDLLMGAPNNVEDEQLKELSLRLKLPENK